MNDSYRITRRGIRWCGLMLLLLPLPAILLAQRPGFVELSMKSTLVPGEVNVGVLLPPGYDEETSVYALVLLLHGGGGSSVMLERLRPLIEAAWDRGDLLPVVFATPSTGRSFYMDFRDGSERWETFIMAELLPELRRRFRVRPDAAGTVISGISMGGMGSLRLAFKHPDRFAAVAALEPAIEPAFAYDEIEPADRAYRPDELYERIFGDPVDREYWRANHPLYIARENAGTLKRSGLQIYLEVGDQDRLNLFRGAEMLHRLLFDAGVKHEYRLVRGADHTGTSIPGRVLNALGFIDRVLRGRL